MGELPELNGEGCLRPTEGPHSPAAETNKTYYGRRRPESLHPSASLPRRWTGDGRVCPTYLRFALSHQPGPDDVQRQSGDRRRHARHGAAHEVQLHARLTRWLCGQLVQLAGQELEARKL